MATVMRAGDIRNRILRGFRILGRARTRRHPYKPRLSSAGTCIRALSYHRQGYPETDPPPPILGNRFDVGDALHLYLDARLRRLHLPLELREHEVRIPFKYGVITGHFDRSIGGTTIVDFKTASDASFELMARTNEPLSSHRAQLNGYLEAASRTPGLQQYTEGLVVALNVGLKKGKDDDLWISPPLTRDPALALETIAKFEQVEEHAQRGTLPARPHDSPHRYPCDTCAWRSLCWGALVPKDATAPADLGALEADAARFNTLSTQVKALEAERDVLGGRLQAALTDANTRKGVAGPWDVTLISYMRRSLDPDLVPPEIRAQAMTETPVVYPKVTRRDGPAGSEAAEPP